MEERSKGGSRLARSPAKISLLDIYRAIHPKRPFEKVQGIQPMRIDQRAALYVKKAGIGPALTEASLLAVYLKVFGFYTFLAGAPLPNLKLSSVRLQLGSAVEKAIESGFEDGLRELKNQNPNTIAKYEGRYSTFRRRYYIATLIAAIAILPKDFASYQTLWKIGNPFGETSVEYRQRTGIEGAVQQKLKDWEEAMQMINVQPTTQERDQERDRIRQQLTPLY